RLEVPSVVISCTSPASATLGLATPAFAVPANASAAVAASANAAAVLWLNTPIPLRMDAGTQEPRDARSRRPDAKETCLGRSGLYTGSVRLIPPPERAPVARFSPSGRSGRRPATIRLHRRRRACPRARAGPRHDRRRAGRRCQGPRDAGGVGV